MSIFDRFSRPDAATLARAAGDVSKARERRGEFPCRAQLR
jgi:hypothetical protein